MSHLEVTDNRFINRSTVIGYLYILQIFFLQMVDILGSTKIGVAKIYCFFISKIFKKMKI